MRFRARASVAKAATRTAAVAARAMGQEPGSGTPPSNGVRTMSMKAKKGFRATIHPAAGATAEGTQKMGVTKNISCITLVTIGETSRKRAPTSASSRLAEKTNSTSSASAGRASHADDEGTMRRTSSRIGTITRWCAMTRRLRAISRKTCSVSGAGTLRIVSALATNVFPASLSEACTNCQSTSPIAT